jgi:hypothetical protein
VADATLPEQRIVEALPLLAHTRGREAEAAVITGWAALRWLGARWFDGTVAGGRTLAPVPILLGPDRAPQPGFLFSEERRGYTTYFEHDGMPLSDPWRSTGFEMRYAPSVREAAVILSMACQADLVSLEEMADYLHFLNGWTGIPQARAALPLAGENFWSPQEVRMALAWQLECGFEPALANVPIFDHAGQHVLTPDLFDPVAGVCGEYDGKLHLEGGQRRRDRNREERARDFGLEYFTVLAGDLGTSRCLDRMAAARARARFEPEDRRRWTLESPPWWRESLTVAQRRANSARRREESRAAS